MTHHPPSPAARAVVSPARQRQLWKAQLRRFVSAWPLLFSCPFAAAETLPHIRRQILERISDGKFFHRVPRFRIRRERLTQLLGPTEATTKREILSQRIPFPILL